MPRPSSRSLRRCCTVYTFCRARALTIGVACLLRELLGVLAALYRVVEYSTVLSSNKQQARPQTPRSRQIPIAFWVGPRGTGTNLRTCRKKSQIRGRATVQAPDAAAPTARIALETSSCASARSQSKPRVNRFFLPLALRTGRTVETPTASADQTTARWMVVNFLPTAMTALPRHMTGLGLERS